MNLNIDIRNNTKLDISKIDFNKLNQNLKLILEKKINCNCDIFVCIHIITKLKMQKLNSTFREIQKPTDVLSFPIYKNLKNIDINAKEVSLGDIFICKEIAKNNIKNSNKTEFGEIFFLIKHGFKHLIGIHHK